MLQIYKSSLEKEKKSESEKWKKIIAGCNANVERVARTSLTFFCRVFENQHRVELVEVGGEKKAMQ